MFKREVVKAMDLNIVKPWDIKKHKQSLKTVEERALFETFNLNKISNIPR